jgi:hypothetical protein
MTVCKVGDCERAATGRGYCNPHYQRWRRYGSPTERRSLAGLSASERIAARSQPVQSGCVEWTGSRDRNGYGVITWQDKHWRAHRLAYETSVGPIPPGMVLRHICDNPPCVLVSHLVPGTAAENVRDMIERNPDHPLQFGGKVSGWRKRASMHCQSGQHEFTPENTYWYRGNRQCRACRRAAWMRAYQRKRQAQPS